MSHGYDGNVKAAMEADLEAPSQLQGRGISSALGSSAWPASVLYSVRGRAVECKPR